MARIDSTIKLRDGKTLGYSTYGNPDGVPLLYFHGGISSRLDIEFADEEARQLNIRLIAPDRQGIGLSDRQKGRTLTHWTETIYQLITALDLNKPAILSWSLGGAYALACAAKLENLIGRSGTVGGVGPLDYPGAIQNLGILEDRIMLSWPDSVLFGLEPFGRLASFLPPGELRKSLLRVVKDGRDYEICNALSPHQASYFILEAFRTGAGGVLDDYIALKKPWEFDVKDIKSEFSYWIGADDKICPRSAADNLIARLPNSTLNVVENSGHFLLRDHFGKIAQYLLGRIE